MSDVIKILKVKKLSKQTLPLKKKGKVLLFFLKKKKGTEMLVHSRFSIVLSGKKRLAQKTKCKKGGGFLTNKQTKKVPFYEIQQIPPDTWHPLNRLHMPSKQRRQLRHLSIAK